MLILEKDICYIQNIKNTVVKPSTVHGYGLFAVKDIPQNTLLCILTGQLMNKSDFASLIKSKRYKKECFLEQHHLKNDLVMITPFRTSYSFINHNSEISHIYESYQDKAIKVYAKIDIKQGEEIFDTYNLNRHIDILKGFKQTR